MMNIENISESILSLQEVKMFLKIDNEYEDSLITTMIQAVDCYIQKMINISISDKIITMEYDMEEGRIVNLPIRNKFEILNYCINNQESSVLNLYVKNTTYVSAIKLARGNNKIRIKLFKAVDFDLKLKAMQHVSILYQNRGEVNNANTDISLLYNNSRNIRI